MDTVTLVWACLINSLRTAGIMSPCPEEYHSPSFLTNIPRGQNDGKGSNT
jgi:hypothetical protein